MCSNKTILFDFNYFLCTFARENNKTKILYYGNT